MKKFIRFFYSMKFALILLIVLAMVCTAGSFIPQNDIASYYTSNYPQAVAGLILMLGLDDVFHCPWFIVLVCILCLNLLGCNILRFPSLIGRTKNGYTPERALKRFDPSKTIAVENPEDAFGKLGFRKIVQSKDEKGRNALYAVKNKIGIWGAWLCHLGMLIIIIGFGLGQMLKSEYTVYGIPGEKRMIGDTQYELTIDDFQTILREDDTVDQYTSWLTIENLENGQTVSGETSVNAPASMFGMKFYQNSTGWAANVKVMKNGETVQEKILCAGEFMQLEELPEVHVQFSAFYPDYVLDENGKSMTKSSRLNNPGYLYMLYYGNQVLGMNVLTGDDIINLDDYQIVFSDPQQYTLIQIKRDPFTLVAAIGGLLVLISLFFAFYLRTAEVWAVEVSDGQWVMDGFSRKGGIEFRNELEKLGKKQNVKED